MGILTIIFVICKIFGFIDWSWWIVFLPLWGFPALGISILASVGIVAGIIWLAICAMTYFENQKMIKARKARYNS